MSPVRETKPVADLEIQEWIHARFGFVPHPYWISHCKEIYLHDSSGETRRPWHECPPDKRSAVRDAFRHFGILKP